MCVCGPSFGSRRALLSFFFSFCLSLLSLSLSPRSLSVSVSLAFSLFSLSLSFSVSISLSLSCLSCHHCYTAVTPLWVVRWDIFSLRVFWSRCVCVPSFGSRRALLSFCPSLSLCYLLSQDTVPSPFPIGSLSKHYYSLEQF